MPTALRRSAAAGAGGIGVVLVAKNAKTTFLHTFDILFAFLLLDKNPKNTNLNFLGSIFLATTLSKGDPIGK